MNLINFNPNKPSITKNYNYATFIQYRNPEFKLHHQRNHATTAIGYHSHSDRALYKWVDGEWMLMGEYPKSGYQELCSDCNTNRASYGLWEDQKTDHPKYRRVCWECRKQYR